MASVTLLIAGVASIVTGLGFGFVARAVSQRDATGPRLLARRAHTAWWGGLGTYLVLQGALTLLAAFDALDVGTYLASRALAVPLLCTATWGITFFLTFLYTGRKEPAPILGALYAIVMVVFLYETYSLDLDLVVGRWVVGLEDTSPVFRAIYAVIGLPPILASLAYLYLLRRTSDAEQRYRISLIAGSILLYIGSGLAARLSANDAVIFLTLVGLGFAAAAASLLAYYPPPALRARFEGGR